MSEHARKRARAVLRGRDDGNIILLPDRSFTGWYRHITLVLVALAFLTGVCAQTIPLASPLLAGEALSTLDAAWLARPLLPLTVPEVRHLLGQLLWPPPSSVKLVLAWSRLSTLASQLCQLFPYQTSSPGRLAGSLSFAF